MARSLALPLYLALTSRATGFAERTLARRLAAGKEDPGRLDERRGIAGRARPPGRLIWFHAASVGEALSIQELIRRLGSARPELSFLITTGTVTSSEILASRLPPRTIHQYIPLDLRPYVRRFLAHWQPDLAVWTESELWPALMCETHARRVPMLLVNARISGRSHRHWRWLPGAAKTLVGLFRGIYAQDATTAIYLRRLGAPASALKIVGTLKEGSAALPCDEAERAALARMLAGRPVWLAASTHAGEEEMVVAAHGESRRTAHLLLLILAPRHPERGADLAARLTADGWSVALRSRGDTPGDETEIYIADSIGEMGLWYRLAPVSFVGGSLVEVGGHNPFEPAALGSAIIHGPHVANFADIYQRLEEVGAALEVRDADTLAQTVIRLLAPDEAARMAAAAWEVSSRGAEVTDLTLRLILDTLDGGAD